MKVGWKHQFLLWLSVGMSAFLVASCGEDRTYQYEELTSGNRQMVEILRKNYLWADEIKTDFDWKGYFGSGDVFFKKLLSSQDRWSYCTIDTVKADMFERGYFNHYNSYGMDFDLIGDPTGATSRNYVRVLYVAQGSQAEKAGMKRGDFISYIGATRITNSNVRYIVNGDGISMTVNHLAYNAEEEQLYWADTTEVWMEKSAYVEDYPYFATKVFDFGISKIGYLMVTRLIAGPYEKDPASTLYRDDLDRYFSNFKSADIDHLIVDLRYCNHGEMEMAQRLASYVAAQKHDGEVWTTTRWREDLSQNNTEQCYDLALTNGHALDVNKVVFITGKYTTGAAEWLIQGLRHTLGSTNVITVGEKTAGQNVMTTPVATDFNMTLYPAVAYVGDAEGNHDYTALQTPTVSVKEMEYVYLNEYGTTEEILLQYALSALLNSTGE